jgi:hypothetical protein
MAEMERARSAWLLAERALRTKFSTRFHQHAIDWICRDLEPRVIEMMLKAPPLALPGVVNAECREVASRMFNRITLTAFFQLVRLERELYEAKFGPASLVPGGARATATQAHYWSH